MHDSQHIQRHVQVPLSAGHVGGVGGGTNSLVGRDSMAGIRWTCSKTRKPSCFKSEGDSKHRETDWKVTSA
jgi:hypothetical protein